MEILSENGRFDPIEQAQYDQAEKQYQQLSLKMQEGVGGLEPSKQQFAAAFVAIRHPGEKLLMSQPPGTGKTRTLVSLAYIMASLGGYKDITLRFTSKLTLQQD